jgi:hypothetical protein
VALQGPVRQQRRDHPPDVAPRRRRDLRVLPEQQEELAGVGPDRGDAHAGEAEHHHGALLVHAHETVLLRPERLPAQRVQAARHASLYHGRCEPDRTRTKMSTKFKIMSGLMGNENEVLGMGNLLILSSLSSRYQEVPKFSNIKFDNSMY